MPNFGSEISSSQTHVAKQYIDRTPDEIHIPNIVTAVLASYRGYDTLGETAVIFTAGIGILLILGRLGRREKRTKTRKKRGLS